MTSKKRDEGGDPSVMPDDVEATAWKKWALFVVRVGGVLGCYIAYGVLQERLIKRGYQLEDGTIETLPSSLFVVFLNRIVAIAIAGTTILILQGPRNLLPGAPIHLFAGNAIMSTISTTCQYEALRQLSFAAQTIFKSLKITATMIASTLVLGSRFSALEYTEGLVIGAACTAFVAFGGKGGQAAAPDTASLLKGMALMATYVGFDAIIPTMQKKIFRDREISASNQSLYFSLSAATISLVTLLSRRELGPSIAFLQRHPSALGALLGLSAVSAAGQQFIMLTIKHHGPVIFSMSMTTRQVISIALSSIIFSQPLLLSQWLSASAVFLALYAKALHKTPAVRAFSARLDSLLGLARAEGEKKAK